MANRKKDNGNGRRLATPQSVDQAVKSICDIMRRGNRWNDVHLTLATKLEFIIHHF